MTKLEKLEAEIKALSAEEQRQLYDCFARLQCDTWDEQIARDAEAGKLDRLAEKALGEHCAGKTIQL